MIDLTDQVAIVTGAGGGIGEETALSLNSERIPSFTTGVNRVGRLH